MIEKLLADLRAAVATRSDELITQTTLNLFESAVELAASDIRAAYPARCWLATVGVAFVEALRIERGRNHLYDWLASLPPVAEPEATD